MKYIKVKKRKVVCFILIIVCNLQLKAQDIGQLLLGLHTLSTTEITVITNPVTGSLVYNTTDSSIYQFNGAAWVRVFDEANNGTVGTKVNYGARWTNTDTGTNLNVTSVVAPIFGTEDFNDDATSLYVNSGNTLTIKEAGRYDLKANLSFVVVGSARNNPSARIAINGVQVGARSSTGYIRNASGHTQSSIHINETLNLNQDDIISIVMFREGNSGTVRFSGTGESSFIINKLK